MRWIVLVFVLCSNAVAQDIEVLSGQAIGHGAVIHVADLEAKVSKLEAENESLRLQIRELTKGKEPTPVVEPPTIKVFSTENCKLCDDLEAITRPRYIAAGWRWERMPKDQSALPGGYPQIQICTAESCSAKIHVTKDTIDAVVNRFLGRPVIQRMFKPKTVLKRWGQHEGHATPSVIDMSIEYHLTEHHGIDITGMTVAEMEAKHQELHR